MQAIDEAQAADGPLLATQRLTFTLALHAVIASLTGMLLAGEDGEEASPSFVRAGAPAADKELNVAEVRARVEAMEVRRREREEHERRHGAALPAAFAPGEFACPLKFTVAFALNHRLKPANVVHALSSSVLDPFAINNRSHCYVYRDRLGHVFYMRLDARVSEGRPGASSRM